jgi:hypothetical protein
VLRQKEFQILLQELFGQQSALTTRVGGDYQKITKDDDAPADTHMKMISLVFPYEFAVELLSNTDFCVELLRQVLQFRAEEEDAHLKAVSAIFNMIRQFRKLTTLSNSYIFFTAQNPMYFSLAEHFVTMFVRPKMLAVGWDLLRNFSTEEKCALIARQGAQDCGLNPQLLKKLTELGPAGAGESVAEHLRPISDEGFGKNVHVLDTEIPAEVEVQKLYHVVLEIRKVPLGVSPSAMLGHLSNAMHWLTSALHAGAGMQVGADEIFQFFVFCLSVAKLWCLPSLITFIDRHMDDALRETKFNYYIEQLKSALEFIEGRVIPVPPFLLMPFAELPDRLVGRLEQVDDRRITMKGFEIYAFPIWAKECEKFFPALMRYTGSEEIAICYQFRIVDDTDICAGTKMEPILTLHGTFYQLTAQFILENQMVRIDNGDYVKSADDLALVSAMVLMLNCTVANPSIEKIPEMFRHVATQWNVPKGTMIGIGIIVAEVQRALVLLEILPTNFSVDGKMNRETVQGMNVFFCQNMRSRKKTPFVFDQRFFDAMMRFMDRTKKKRK